MEAEHNTHHHIRPGCVLAAEEVTELKYSQGPSGQIWVRVFGARTAVMQVWDNKDIIRYSSRHYDQQKLYFGVAVSLGTMDGDDDARQNARRRF